MKYLINIVFIMCFGQIFAQSTFYYQHNTPYSNQPWDILELEDSYIICGKSDRTGGDFTDGFLMKLDKQGNVLWDKVIEAEKREQYRAVIDVKDGFVLGGFRWVNEKRRNLLVKYDYDGNEIWDKIIGDTLTLGFDNFVQDVAVFENNLFIATSGFDESIGKTIAFLIKTDTEGNIIWQKKYSTTSIDLIIDVLDEIEISNNGFLLKIRSFDIGFNAYHSMIKTDFEGNEIWRKKLWYYNSTTTISDTIIRFKDFCSYKAKGSIAYFVRYDLSTNTSNHILVEFDKFGNEIEFREYPPTAGVVFSDIHSNKNNELFLIGQQDLGKADSLYYQLFSAKFDCNKNLIWEHHYGEKYIGEFYYSSTITSDGGVFIGGRIFNITSSPIAFNSILVKTDCRGLLEWNYESCIDPKITQDVLVFPNPFNDYINIHLPNVPKENEIGIQIFDLKGSLVDNYLFKDTRVVKLNTANYASGFYVVRIFVDGEIYQSEKIIKYG